MIKKDKKINYYEGDFRKQIVPYSILTMQIDCHAKRKIIFYIYIVNMTTDLSNYTPLDQIDKQTGVYYH